MQRRMFLGAAAAWAGGATIGRAHSAATPYILPPEHLPRVVPIRATFVPFEIHVLPSQFALYWTLPDAKAIRYTVGIGRPGLCEADEFYIGAKKEWPSWTPTPQMIEREPERYAQFADGVAGGIDNPLGARALYLFQPGRGDTMLRIHGTNDPTTIGRAVSNGCARLVNDQITELYERVPLGTRVILYSQA
ncbi:putative L,D-transpeptidase ErfK/SrfK [Defluviimonas aquaemixtae]|uniref:Putative L,D-transpeptidase ErfK/SrfK n=1 Tax=Albidovulum aquaemixtae TaxID=1542388 RepID=A0A2R8B6M4_9RHOB|nr:L,D-transpeptidase [Defluviimonas aquaemixtae]SPH18257.1 putative L,D-transpeptidase ErfK/SrfK [Defluviimonas aquaemixtae]